MLITILVIAAVALAGYALWKRGDQDGDGDVDLKDITLSAKEVQQDIEEGVENIVDQVEDTIEDVKEWTENVADELKDVIAVIRNKPTKSNLNKLTKAQLVAAAKTDFDVDLDISVRKSTLVNKVYSLYN